MANVGTRLWRMRNVFILERSSLNLNVRTYASALFVPGYKANQSFSILTPEMNFDEQFSDAVKFRKEMELRGVDADIESMKSSWEMYKTVISDRDVLEDKRIDAANQIKRLSRKKANVAETADDEEINRLKVLARVLKNDLKTVRQMQWDLEDVVIPAILKLPNVLHKETPAHDPTILYSYKKMNSEYNLSCSSSHIDIGRSLGLLEYTSPMNYYLHDKAALFELGVLRLAAEMLVQDQVLRVTGLDFVRSVIIEATGMDHESPNDSFILEDNEEVEKNSVNRMHLIGGASLPSFLTMHTKQLINPKTFPLEYFASGRQYVPFNSHAQEDGLFTVCQASAAEVFTLMKDPTNSDYWKQFLTMIDFIKVLYTSICNHYRIVLRPARDLRPWESLRASFEVWSPYSKGYIEVGHLSLSGDYLSRRLLIACQTHYGRIFPFIISGTVLSVPRLLGCLLEQSPKEFVIPIKVQEHIPA
ncbi:serine--tRNA synthetase-like protein Slimp [Diprion similis]|uniref:serine--tRNA synthetase-like protein Slimp n=1 Tax=Diprion similis TaxID=362088 RepID=UPI001EF8C396|nr:serine--tRNA synthetase-like protein Slimp [Diprion similis]